MQDQSERCVALKPPSPTHTHTCTAYRVKQKILTGRASKQCLPFLNLFPPTYYHLTSLCRAPPLKPLPCPPLSPPLREAVFKQRNVVVFLAGCACRLMPTPGFSRRPVLFLALISGWKFGNRCLKPCKRF